MRRTPPHIARMKTLPQLVAREDSALPVLLEWARLATNAIQVRAPDKMLAAETLVEMQVTTASPLGAIAFHTGGLSVADGFVRVLGSSDERGVRDWNRAAGVLDQSYVLVADDVLGGQFAMNHGGFAGPDGMVHYLPPDQLEWVDLNSDYGDFLGWCFSGDLPAFYAAHAWERWLTEDLPGWGEAWAFAPLPWTAPGADLAALSREVVPAEAVWRAKREFMALAA